MFRNTMIEAIRSKKIVNLTFNSYEKGQIERSCIPFDIGPGSRGKDKREKYHFFTLDSPEGGHNLSIIPDQTLNLNITDNTFNPRDYVKWTPNWFVPRDWGAYS